MEENHLQRVRDSQTTSNNGAVPIKRARTELAAGPTDVQIRRRKEAEKEYGRGRKIHGMFSEMFHDLGDIALVLCSS